MNIKKEIDEEKLKKLYLEDNLSFEKISKIFNVSRNTIRNRIKKLGLEKTNKKINISKEELYDMYINRNLSQKEISQEKSISLKKLQRLLAENNIKKPKDKFYEKIKLILKEKYNVENVSQIEYVKEKKVNKSIEKYGVDNISKSSEIKNKKKQKALQRYGVEYVLSSNEVKQKIKETNLKVYGVENVNQSDVVKSKTKKTNLQKYGVEYPSQNKEIKYKIIQTNLKKYGVKCVLQSPEIKEKIAKTNIKKYGNSSILKNKIIKEKTKETNLKVYGVPYYCMTENCRKSNGNVISKINKNFSKKLLLNNINNKLEKAIKNKSFDIEIIGENILLEINPTYTHNVTYGSEFRGYKKKPLEKNYHYEKTKLANKYNYRCIHIWDWDDENKIINMLKPKIKIYARKCECKEINNEKCAEFLENNHLQGNCRGQKIRIGLFFENELVEVMTFGKPRYNRKYEYELIRLCTHNSYKIIGGSNKLFNYFLKKYNPKNIISYCDNSKFSGKVYSKLGFKEKDYGRPSKHWYNMKTKQHITDNLLRQRGFDQLFNTNYGKGTFNEELMIKNGFVEIYDCGQSIYFYERK